MGVSVALRSRRTVAGLMLAGAAVGGVAVAVPVASANNAAVGGPKLKINPAQIFYPCSEGNVTFSVSGFTPSSSVLLHIGATANANFGVIQTNSNGAGSSTVSFAGYYPGTYKIFAVGSSQQASKVLLVETCP